MFGTGECEEFGPRDRGRNNKVQIASFAATGNALARSFGCCYDALEGELERPLVGVGGQAAQLSPSYPWAKRATRTTRGSTLKVSYSEVDAQPLR